VKINNLETNDDTLIQALVIVAGQFRPDPDSVNQTGDVIGIQRLYSNLEFDVLRNASEDYTPPTIEAIDLIDNTDGTISVIVEVGEDIDNINIDLTTLLLYLDTELYEIEPNSISAEDNSIIINIEEPLDTDYSLIIQVADTDDNVAVATGKGVSLSAIEFHTLSQDPDPVYEENVVTLHATIQGFSNLTKPVFYTWDFGDGTLVTGTSTDGTITVTHTYAEAGTYETKLKVTDSSGGIGNAIFVVKVYWWDDLDYPQNPNGDFAGFTVDNDDTTMTITMVVYGTISDEFQYRVKLEIEESSDTYHLKYFDGKVTGIEGAESYVSGNTLELTFNLSSIGVTSGDYIKITSETQAGVKAETQVGFADEMPDDIDFFEYIVY
jgi:PKD repeat protein